MTFREHLALLRAGSWLIVPSIVIAVIVAIVISGTLPRRWEARVTLYVGQALTAIKMDQPPVGIAAAHEHRDTLVSGLFEKRDAVRVLEHARSAGRNAVEKQGILLQEILLAHDVQITRPILERCDLRGVFDIGQQAVSIGFNRNAGFHQ